MTTIKLWEIIYMHSELLSFWTSSIVQYSKNATFRKLDLFPSTGQEGKTPSQLGPLERANLNHWTFQNTGRWTKSINLVILSVIHHRQNPLEST
jgi:hypothetical protein